MKQEELKDKLFSGVISFKEFYDGIIALDQSSGDRIEAFENLKVLSTPEMQGYIVHQDESIKRYYFSALGLTEFHIGQIKAYKEKKQDDSLPHFKRSLECTLKSNTAPEFAEYTKATIAYLENDIEKMGKHIKGDNRGNNPIIMKHMFEGLKERGFPAYWEDYRV